MNDENSIKVAVLQEQIGGLREQHRAQSLASEHRSEALSQEIKNGKLEMSLEIRELKLQVAQLVATLNKGKGAWAMFILASGLAGALLLKIVSAVFSFSKSG